MQNDTLGIRAEFFRKSIHLSSSILPLSYLWFLSWEQIVYISGFISIGFIIAEVLRGRSNQIQKIYLKIFGSLLRQNEKSTKITGATFLFISLTIIFIFFEKKVAIAAALILTIADSMAAILGKKYGRKKFLNKTVTGSFTFFVASNVILFIFLPEIGLLNIIIIAILTVIEALPIPISDNVTIPVSAGALITGAAFIKGVIV